MDLSMHTIESMGFGLNESFSAIGLDAFSAAMQNVDQTNSMLDSLFSFDNMNVVPPFVDNMAL